MNSGKINLANKLPDKEMLDQLSFRTTLGRSLKKISLKDKPLEELLIDVSAYRAVTRTLLISNNIENVRFKSDDSIERKYQKTILNGLGFLQCFNDLIGIRLRLDKYPETFPEYYRVVDLRNGKRIDDGYRAIHLYYQKDNYSYPIEIQLWCGADYCFNLWSHMTVYKYTAPIIGRKLYEKYHLGKIISLEQFEMELRRLEEETL